MPPTGPAPAFGPTPGPDRRHWALPKTAEETSLAPVEPRSRAVAGPPLASISLAAIAATVGVALVFNTLAGTFVGAVAVAGISTVIIGLAIAVSAFRGRTLPLVPLALLSLLILPAAPIIDHALRDGIRSRTVSVSSVEDLRSSYRTGIGVLDLNLHRLDLTEDTTIDVSVGTGAAEISVPADAVVEVRSTSVVGSLQVLGQDRSGINPALNVVPSSSVDPNAPRLTINVSTDVGSVEVYRVSGGRP